MTKLKQRRSRKDRRKVSRVELILFSCSPYELDYLLAVVASVVVVVSVKLNETVEVVPGAVVVVVSVSERARRGDRRRMKDVRRVPIILAADAESTHSR